ncbi:hypothetical protein PCASD_14097 [Puccinia coronata f. sp. avenae]|uniref:ferric-chelate reductase (NADPH) n=1 Tax=Puccinia coronata f. sp. avenae TaxID=200324 RepID=A0A2N5U734_9BASI|nr:hypothetical protein PCASD_14097 [Puccinia coronata f. sp. avenae]
MANSIQNSSIHSQPSPVTSWFIQVPDLSDHFDPRFLGMTVSSDVEEASDGFVGVLILRHSATRTCEMMSSQFDGGHPSVRNSYLSRLIFPGRYLHRPMSSGFQMTESQLSLDSQLQKEANQLITAEALSFLLGSFLAGFFLAALIRSPFTIIYVITGRFKQGWILRRSRQTAEISIVRNWRFPGIPHTINAIKARRAQILFVEYLYWYNRLTLQSIWGCQLLTLAKLSVGLFYVMVVIISILWKNSSASDLLSHFRRPASIAMFQFPILFLLAMKNNLCGFLGVGHERINFLHRLIGRTVVLCSIIHAGIIWKAQVSPPGQLLKQPTFLYGAISLAMMIFLTLTSIGPVRKRFYQCFLGAHIFGYILLLFALWKHVKDTHLPIMLCCGCKIVDQMLQAFNTRFRTAQFTSLPGKITIIEVPNLGTGWRAGQFVFLRIYSRKYVLEKHPFTIANAPATDSPYGAKNNLVLIAKANGDYTRRIHEIGLTKAAMESECTSEAKKYPDPWAQSMFPGHTKSELGLIDSSYGSQLLVSVEGPYGHTYQDMRSHETVVLVGAGVGCTFVMSLFEEVVGSSLRGLASTRNILIYWTLRDIDMLEFFVDPIRENLRIAQSVDVAVQIKIYVTSTMGIYRPPPFRELTVTRRRMNIIEVVNESVNITIAEINALGRSDPASGIGIASAGVSPSFSKALRDATLSIDHKTFSEIGGITVHTEIFDNQ